MTETLLDLPKPDRLGKETMSQWVYRSLRHAVMIGRVTPGRSLTIRGIAEALGVSTMPVREALRRLAAEKALEIRDNRRVIVPVMTAAKFHELVGLRIALETHAAIRAMPFLSAAAIEALKVLDEGIDIAHLAEGHEKAAILNQEFHRRIYEANPDQVAMPLIESVWLQLGPFLHLTLSHLEDHYQVDRHVEALDALRRQDAPALRAAIEADIRDGIGHIGEADLFEVYDLQRTDVYVH